MYPNLKLQLWRKGIRQNRLALSLGMDETMLSKIVNGFREPSPEIRGKIAVLLQTDEAWLFERVAGTPRSVNGAAPQKDFLDG
jgi:transcriptional regulator with XRE-family HTH domain